MKGCFILEWADFLFPRSGEGGIVYKSLQSCSAEWRHAGLSMQQKLGEYSSPPPGPAPCCWASKRLRSGPAPQGAHSPQETYARDCCVDSEWLGLNPDPQLSRVCTQSHSRAGASARRGHGQPECAWRVREASGGGGMLELEQSGDTQNRKGHTRERASQVQPFGGHLHSLCRIPVPPALSFT